VVDGEWRDLIDVSALNKGDVTPVVFDDLLLAVYDGVRGITISSARCTHAGANLCDGYFDGRHIECPLHQGLFDVVTGAARAAPVVQDMRMFESRVVAGVVQIYLS